MTYVIRTPSRGPASQALTLQGRLVHRGGSGVSVTDEGNLLQQADFTSITCAVYDLDSATPDVTIATPSVVVTTAISDTAVDDEIWTLDSIGRNFIHTISGTVLSDAHLYRVVYTATLSVALGSELLYWVYQHQAVAVTTATPTRASQDDVRAIVDADPDINLTAFIVAANVLTDRVEACATDRGKDLTVQELTSIETYLAAHFYTGRDPRYKSKKTERASASFFGKNDQFLEMAKLIDTSGCLDSFGREQYYVEFEWLGKSPSDQILYVDRD